MFYTYLSIAMRWRISQKLSGILLLVLAVSLKLWYVCVAEIVSELVCVRE